MRNKRQQLFKVIRILRYPDASLHEHYAGRIAAASIEDAASKASRLFKNQTIKLQACN